MKKKKKVEPEYSLNIFRRKDERSKKRHIVFLLRTTKEFTSFRYEILLDQKLKGNAIEFRILGIHAPELLMPSTGPALAQREFDDLRGRFELTVTKLDGQSNRFSVDFAPREISVKSITPTPFVSVSTEPMDLE